MGLFLPLVIESGEVRQLVFSSSEQIIDGSNVQRLINAEATTINVAEVMYVDSVSGDLKRAKADSITTAKAAFLCVDGFITAGNFGAFIAVGVLQTALSLSVNTTYFLSASTAGAITSTPPTTAGHFVVRIGIGMSNDRLLIGIQPPIKRA